MEVKVEIVEEEGETFFKMEISGDKYLFEETGDLLRFAKQNKIRLVF